MRLNPGARLGRFEILGPIGSGGMGEVYRARDRKLGREVAVKVLPEWMSEKEDARARFEREARAVAALSHPNVLTLFDVGHSGSILYTVLELLEGESLRDLLARGPQPWIQAIRIAKCVADGLAAAHAKGIVHRDVKPGNIFLTRTGQVKILDFGLARVVQAAADDGSSETATGAVLGTTGYMSPEQASGDKLDGRSDIFSLGCVLFEMLTGTRPFQGETVMARMMAVIQDEPAKLTEHGVEVPPEVERILATCLAKRRDDRFISAERLADALESLSAYGSGTLVLPPSVLPHPPSHRWLWLGLATAAVIGTAAVFTLSRALDNRGLLLGSGWRPRQLTSAPGWEGEPAISPDGSLVAYASDEAGNPDIWLLDLRAGDPLRLTDDPASDRSPTWFPNGTAIAFASDRGGSAAIWKIARLGGSAVMLLPDAQDPAISPNGTMIAFARADRSGALRIGVSPLADPSGAKILTEEDDGLWEHRHPVWSPDGTRICYSAFRDLWVVPLSGGEPRRLTSEHEADSDPAWSPDGTHVYFTSLREGSSALWRVPAGGGEAERLTLGTGPERDPSLSRDRSRLVYSTYIKDDDIVILDRETGRVSRLASVRFEETPAVAPDGSAVVYVSDRRGHGELWLQRLADARPAGTPQLLAEHPGAAATPTFSSDGRLLAFFRVIDGQRDIWTLPVKGGLPTQVTTYAGLDIHPAFSPDGSQLAFVSDREGGRHVWVVPIVEGRRAGEPRRLTEGLSGDSFPTWSPSGEMLAWVADSGEHSDVWIMDLSRTSPPRKVTSGIIAHRAAWSRAGEAIFVSGTADGGQTSLWTVSIADGVLQEVNLDPGFGIDTWGHFDLSRDGRVLAYVSGRSAGDLWMLEGAPGRL